MIAATYKIGMEEPRILTTVSGPAKWRVELWHRLDGEITSRIISPQTRCTLHDLMPVISAQIADLIDDMPEVTDAGFTVMRLR
jgi:hypothetical protein